MAGGCPVADLVPVVASGGEAAVEMLELQRAALFVLGGGGPLPPGDGTSRGREAVVARLIRAEAEGEGVDAEAIAASRLAAQASKGRSGRSAKRSMEMLANPAARAAAIVATTSSGVCRRPRARRAVVSITCTPTLSRVTPACTTPAKSPRSSAPGFASRVTSASGASPKRSRMRSINAASRSVGRSDGVPPPR
jgi:hypothetical protein